ncbi:MAG TPA: SRPBCC domain-containing protein [Kineosporiaceae bacterium]|nr:SRPBCC domain-containing protein [Kineosporiaceae bacterium]
MTRTVSQKTADSYRADVRFVAAPDAVFEAFTTVTGIAGWWTEQVSGSGAQGGQLTLGFPNSDGPRVVLHVDTTERARSIVWSVLAVPPLPAWEEWAGTRVVVRLRPDGDGGTGMGFGHEGLTPQLHCYDTCSRGWDGVLASLRSYVDTGTGHPYS